MPDHLGFTEAAGLTVVGEMANAHWPMAEPNFFADVFLILAKVLYNDLQTSLEIANGSSAHWGLSECVATRRRL